MPKVKILHFLEGRRFTEIAEATGIGYDNLRKRASKAIQLLQAKVNPLVKVVLIVVGLSAIK